MNLFKFIGKAFVWLTRRASAIDKWRKLIPMSDLIDFIAQAEAFNEMSGPQKRAYVSKRITAWAKSRGLNIPESVVNYLIEEALQVFLEQIGREPKTP